MYSLLAIVQCHAIGFTWGAQIRTYGLGEKRFAQSSRQLSRRVQNIPTHSIRCNRMDAAAGLEVSITSNIPTIEICHHIPGNTVDIMKRILRFDSAFTYTHPQMVVERDSRFHVGCLYQATVTQKSKCVQPSLQTQRGDGFAGLKFPAINLSLLCCKMPENRRKMTPMSRTIIREHGQEEEQTTL